MSRSATLLGFCSCHCEQSSQHQAPSSRTLDATDHADIVLVLVLQNVTMRKATLAARTRLDISNKVSLQIKIIPMGSGTHDLGCAGLNTITMSMFGIGVFDDACSPEQKLT
ncbi:uncharacterized protein K460DRAFT_143184 [Cucurbitaria berberidis CBS 394.84]|uniref:Uncharacterized protein n=1 Tax=Cucurbitaria berberidis CBS 394.84 TaxID=1168544 RepID=A0A9P4GD34_9PLEO|nr:uncharacterized protein K460DRAFT_143184 [Cucurbitaria berberidis CBS 394.84]KAF1843316.1 hypothetical protein K460DRAFT_143184 [Cucurbitaria berberidis CBS 394.84]